MPRSAYVEKVHWRRRPDKCLGRRLSQSFRQDCISCRALRRGESGRPLGGTGNSKPVLAGAEKPYDRESCMLDCLDVALWPSTLAEERRSDTSLIGRLTALVARLARPPNVLVIRRGRVPM